jgi:hypothetical protein
MIAHLHPIATQAKYIGDPHRGGAKHVTLDSNPVLVTAGNL